MGCGTCQCTWVGGGILLGFITIVRLDVSVLTRCLWFDCGLSGRVEGTAEVVAYWLSLLLIRPKLMIIGSFLDLGVVLPISVVPMEM